MNKNKSIFLIVGIFLSIILLFIVLSILQRPAKNEVYETGNTAGNLNNQGLFCERNDIVYFSNAYDNNVLYSMNSDETNLKRLNDVGVSSINADSHRIFYKQTGTTDGSGLGYVRNTVGMYYCDHNGKRTYCMTKDPVGILALNGNSIYYQHYQENIGVPLDKISIGKRDSTRILPDMVSPSCMVDNTIYYAGNGKDHYLYALDTTTATSTLIWKHPVWNPIYQDGYIFCMDLNRNYALLRYDLATGETLALTTERIDFFNVYGNIIYYQTTSPSPALKRIHTDGTGEEIIMQGIFESVNITSYYAYFNEYGKETPVYHQSTYGPVSPSVFNPAMEE